ncbi:MAG: Glycosyl transferase family 39 [Candidatus Curtissbacteria bacterium GW2011_GWA1_40_16]|uniref:Glycosyl transferase family 39 n=1 Tax=Candidatus Curtissbacteria bacterium GW2011_GWA1_40_16 TaxID=1618405 RepID=A0A0G0R6Z7_9BACT|nr:MAG: Glycosyl transferase family 39 [Candidatus Curtissbacteria bacterium GW2011_GWA1_40_16]
MQKFKDKNYLLILIIFLALILRFYQLGKYPPSLFIDELSNGYNAYSILKTGRDEYGNLLPLIIKSFGDYNPALSVYTLIPSIAAFGLNETGVRFPSALLGTLTVILTYFIALKISHNQKIAQVSAFLLAIAPWHLQFSRYDHEANFMVFFSALAITLFLFAKKRFLFLISSAFSFGLAFNTYHAAKVWVPLFILCLIFWHQTEMKELKLKKIAILFLILSLFTLPILLNIKNSLIRGQSTGVFKEEKSLEIFFSGYLSHFSPNFLFINGDSIGRHSVEGMGELYVFELPLLFFGLIYLVHKIKEKNEKFLLTWLLLSPIPAALATPSPHALRSLTIIPTLWIISAYGLKKMMSLKNINLRYIALTGIFLIFIYNLITYLHLYYVHYPKIKALDWTYGYKQVFEFIKPIESRYQAIAISNYYGWPYIAALFYLKFDPDQYQKQSQDKSGFYKYEFFKDSWQKTKPGKALVVTPQWQGHPPTVLHQIYFPNGDMAFRVSEEK